MTVKQNEHIDHMDPEHGSSSEDPRKQTDEQKVADELNVEMKAAIEALIFASEEPIPLRRIREMMETARESDEARDAGSDPEEPESDSDESGEIPPHRMPRRKARRRSGGLTPQRLTEYIESLNREYATSGRSFRIIAVAGGYAFQTTKEYSVYVSRLFADKMRRRLSHSALETLAIVAFRQPVSKPVIESLRGVHADFVIKSLLEKQLIAIVGREESVGRPLLYGTTETFLKHFGLSSLEELPKLREIEEIFSEEESGSPATFEYDTSEEEREHGVVIPPEEGIFKTVPYSEDFQFEPGEDAPVFRTENDRNVQPHLPPKKQDFPPVPDVPPGPETSEDSNMPSDDFEDSEQ